MSDENQVNQSPEEYRASLIERANAMGITFAKNISDAALAKRIQDRLTGADADQDDNAEVGDNQVVAKVVDALADERLRQTALVRVIITAMNPSKASLESEIFCVSNDIQTDKRCIQFGKPWHVTQGLLEHIESLTYQAFQIVKTPQGETPVPHEVPAYGIKILPPLSEEELQAIATKQASETF